MSVQSTLKLEKLKFSAPSSLSDGDPPYKMRRKIQQQHKLVLIILTGYDTTNSDSSSEEERVKNNTTTRPSKLKRDLRLDSEKTGLVGDLRHGGGGCHQVRHLSKVNAFYWWLWAYGFGFVCNKNLFMILSMFYEVLFLIWFYVCLNVNITMVNVIFNRS